MKETRETREEHIKRLMPKWEVKRRECDERELREGCACVPEVYERPDYDAITARLRSRDNFERAEVLVLVIDSSGVGEVILEGGNGEVIHAKAKGFMEMGR